MFGYVLRYPPEMKVKEERLYSAIYCGLCEEIKKNVSVFLMPFLSYDFVFLAAFRMAVTDEKYEIGSKRCFLHPLKKRPIVKHNSALEFSGVCHLFLTDKKMLDDISDKDTSLIKRLIFRLFRRMIAKKVNFFANSEKYSEICQKITEITDEVASLEKNGADLDAMCMNSGKLLEAVASYRVTEHESEISHFGDMLGRAVYSLDAIDDVEKDEKKGNFNPYLRKFGTAKEALKNIFEIADVISLYASEMSDSFKKLECDEILGGIIRNVIEFGIGNSMQKIISKENRE